MQTPSLRNLMSSTPVASQLLRPHKLPRVLLGCLEMWQGFYTHNHIKEEPGGRRRPAPIHHPIIQWLLPVSLTTLWGPLGGHHQHLAQAVLVCYAGLVQRGRHQG